MSDIDQFPGMPCYHDDAVWEAAEISAFGEPVRLRNGEPHGTLKICVSGVWYPCGLSDLDMSAGVDVFIESVRALVASREEPS